jgi:hypothetical protein
LDNDGHSDDQADIDDISSPLDLEAGGAPAKDFERDSNENVDQSTADGDAITPIDTSASGKTQSGTSQAKGTAGLEDDLVQDDNNTSGQAATDHGHRMTSGLAHGITLNPAADRARGVVLVPTTATSDLVKTTTCGKWVKDICEPKEEPRKCQFAHHFFPNIVQRVTRNASKHQTCNYWILNGKGCWWPEEFCGYAHGELDPQDIERRAEMDYVMRKQEWAVELRYRCKFESCGAVSDNLEDVVEHCRDCQHRSAGGRVES